MTAESDLETILENSVYILTLSFYKLYTISK